MFDQDTDELDQYLEDHGETWWMDGDCPDCGHVVYNNGKVRLCGENDDQCDWWEVIDDAE